MHLSPSWSSSTFTNIDSVTIIRTIHLKLKIQMKLNDIDHVSLLKFLLCIRSKTKKTKIESITTKRLTKKRRNHGTAVVLEAEEQSIASVLVRRERGKNARLFGRENARAAGNCCWTTWIGHVIVTFSRETAAWWNATIDWKGNFKNSSIQTSVEPRTGGGDFLFIVAAFDDLTRATVQTGGNKILPS